MKVATYNFCQGGADYAAPHRVLTALQPDILLAQEFLDPEEYMKRSSKTWRALGYHDPVWLSVPTHATKRWGSAIVFKQDAVGNIPVPEHLEGWVVGIQANAADWFNSTPRPLEVFSIHTPTKREGNYYIWQAQEVLEFLAIREQEADLLVGGDFNVTISVRSEHEEPKHTPMEREIIDYMRRRLGLINCWQIMNPNTSLPKTFHGNDRANSHIDGIFAPASWYRYLRSCDIVDKHKGWTEGDHYPVVAHFDDGVQTFRDRIPPQRSRVGG